MFARRNDQREHRKTHPQTKHRDSARFKAALKITKYSPGHKDRTHGPHGDKH